MVIAKRLYFSLTPQEAAAWAQLSEGETSQMDIFRKAIKYTGFVVWLVKSKPDLFVQLWAEYAKSKTQQTQNQASQPQQQPQPTQQPSHSGVKPNA
jgi:hypothetical protein